MKMKNVNETVMVIFGHFFVKNNNFTKIIGNNTIQQNPNNIQKPQYTKENQHHLLQNPINNSTSFYENYMNNLSTH